MNTTAVNPAAWLQLLEESGHTPAYTAAGGIAQLGDPDSELNAALKPRLAAELSELGVLRVSGADSHEFLRRILSNPVNVNTHQAEYGALCQPNGRVISNFLLCERADGLYLLPSLDLVEPTRAELSKYVLNSQVEIRPVQDTIARMGLAGDAATALIGDCCDGIPEQPFAALTRPEYTVIRLPGEAPWFALCGDPQALGEVWQAAQRHGLQAAAANAWALVEITNHLARLTLASSAKHLPQALGLERFGTLDFDKGCYPGQEVIIRLSHRGKLKRHLHALRSTLPFSADESILQANGEPAGAVVHAAGHPEGGYALAVLADTAAAPLSHGSGTAVERLPTTTPEAT